MKPLFVIYAAVRLTLLEASALTFTYNGVIQTVESGAAWSVPGIEVGAPFEASLRIAEGLLGQELYPVYLSTGIHPAHLELAVGDITIDLSSFFVSYASVNSGLDFRIEGEGAGPGALWGMWGVGGLEGALFGASAHLYGGPSFTASANLEVPDSGSAWLLLSLAVSALFLWLIKLRTGSRATRSNI